MKKKDWENDIIEKYNNIKTPIYIYGAGMIGKIVIAATLVPMFGYLGVIAAEPIVWFIMIIPLLIKILRMPVWKQKT